MTCPSITRIELDIFDFMVITIYCFGLSVYTESIFRRCTATVMLYEHILQRYVATFYAQIDGDYLLSAIP